MIAVALFLCLMLSGKALTCQDKVDNVLHVKDCDPGSSAAKFVSFSIFTYDANMKPQCRMAGGKLIGDAVLPGNLVLGEGKITILKNLQVEKGTKLLVTLKKLHSPALGTFCENGESKMLLIPSSVCTVDLCSLIGKEMCSVFDAPQTLDVSAFPTEKRHIAMPALSGPLALLKYMLKGEWVIGGKIIFPGNLEACIMNDDVPLM